MLGALAAGAPNNDLLFKLIIFKLIDERGIIMSSKGHLSVRATKSWLI